MRVNNSFPLLALATVLFLFTSCSSSTLFRSPYTNQQQTYHVMPALSDEQTTASYLSGSVTSGASNEFLRDDFQLFQGKWHIAGKLGRNLQGYVGLHGSAGAYDISETAFDLYDYDPVTGMPREFKGPTGTKFMGSLGSTAGLAIVLPLGDRVEWRVLGVESSYGHEFGDYYKIRRSLPDSAILLADRRNTHITLGGFTEWIFKSSNPDKRIGVQLAMGSSLHRLRNEEKVYNNLTPFYLHNTFHFTVRRTTGYIRISAGDYYAAFQSGVSFRL
ncbi:MAG: hypothetical protein JNK20_17360 [Flavipsychrobacter sp.]|jgi:hypothetical protein|nr:hypothetical protein [Flavipsychrobacter sp.]